MPVGQVVRAELQNDAPQMPTYVNSYELSANTPLTIVIPDNADFAVFSPDTDIPNFFIRYTGGAVIAAVVSVATVTDGTASWRNPAYLRVDRNQSFSVISPTSGNLGIAFYTRGN